MISFLIKNWICNEVIFYIKYTNRMIYVNAQTWKEILFESWLKKYFDNWYIMASLELLNPTDTFQNFTSFEVIQIS